MLNGKAVRVDGCLCCSTASYGSGGKIVLCSAWQMGGGKLTQCHRCSAWPHALPMFPYVLITWSPGSEWVHLTSSRDPSSAPSGMAALCCCSTIPAGGALNCPSTLWTTSFSPPRLLRMHSRSHVLCCAERCRRPKKHCCDSQPPPGRCWWSSGQT